MTPSGSDRDVPSFVTAGDATTLGLLPWFSISAVSLPPFVSDRRLLIPSEPRQDEHTAGPAAV